MKLSFIIPCYRSEHTIKNVIDELTEKMTEKPEIDYEIIAVNDCSPDNIWEVLTQICESDKHIKAIDLANNGGKHIAQIAGYTYADGDILINLDDDGQCPVDRLWDLLKPLSSGYDIAIAHYPKKKQSRFKNFGSKVNDLIVNILFNKPKNIVFSNFIARKRFVCDEIIKYHNPRIKMDAITLKITHKIAMVDMEERYRENGSTGYNFKRSFKLLMDGSIGYSVIPIRFAYFFSLLNMLLGFIASICIITNLIKGLSLSLWVIVASIYYASGIILLFIGILGEYIARSYTSSHVPQFVVREKKNFK
ncbi:MAG: glycosyltransferase [Lachnospiraceae bacterium]|nr:glycosyltransferase [Lachnospiraceae bacterium]